MAAPSLHLTTGQVTLDPGPGYAGPCAYTLLMAALSKNSLVIPLQLFNIV